MRVLSLAVLIFLFTAPFSWAAKNPSACAQALTQKPSLYSITSAGRLEINFSTKSNIITALLKKMSRALYGPLKIDNIELAMGRILNDRRAETPFWIRFSEAFGQELEVSDYQTGLLSNSWQERIPKTGPLLIVANHPKNGFEGIALAALISHVRPDVKIALSPILKPVPGMAENAIFVDPYGGTNAARRNLIARQEMTDHLARGGALVIFPSGEVSSTLEDSRIVDRNWQRGSAKLIQAQSEIQVLPIFVDGEPGPAFLKIIALTQNWPRMLRGLKNTLISMMHIREIGRRYNENVSLTIGPLIDGAEFSTIEPDEMTLYLRKVTYSLQTGAPSIP